MRRDCSVSRLPRVIIFSATGRAALARVSVVVIRPCSNRLVTRLRSTARRWAGCFPSFEPEFRCRIAYIVPYSPMFSSDAGAAVWLGSGGPMMRPGSSDFITQARALFTTISLVLFSDFPPEVLGFRLLFLVLLTGA